MKHNFFGINVPMNSYVIYYIRSLIIHRVWSFAQKSIWDLKMNEIAFKTDVYILLSTLSIVQ